MSILMHAFSCTFFLTNFKCFDMTLPASRKIETNLLQKYYLTIVPCSCTFVIFSKPDSFEKILVYCLQSSNVC